MITARADENDGDLYRSRTYTIWRFEVQSAIGTPKGHRLHARLANSTMLPARGLNAPRANRNDSLAPLSNSWEAHLAWPCVPSLTSVLRPEPRSRISHPLAASRTREAPAL